MYAYRLMTINKTHTKNIYMYTISIYFEKNLG